MGRCFQIDTLKRLVTSRYSGEMRLIDVTEQWREIATHPEFNPNFNYLIDLSDVSDCCISSDEVRKLAEELDPFSLGSLRIVIAPQEHLYGITRMYQMSSGLHPNLSVVRCSREANELLMMRGYGTEVGRAAISDPSTSRHRT